MEPRAEGHGNTTRSVGPRQGCHCCGLLQTYQIFHVSVLPLTSHWFAEQGYAPKVKRASLFIQKPLISLTEFLVLSAGPLVHSSEALNTKDVKSEKQ